MNRDQNQTPKHPNTQTPKTEIVEDGRRWVVAVRAAQLLRCGRSTVHRLGDEGFLEDFFLLPHRRYFLMDSVLKIKSARATDREYWSTPR